MYCLQNDHCVLVKEEDQGPESFVFEISLS